MASFPKLDDSPMFRKQLHSLEQIADDLKDRCLRLQKGCKKFMGALGEACDGDIAFADSLESFGGGCDDPVSVSIGGPVISKFITAFRELGSYKELLRSQVEHLLIDRVMEFMVVDLQEAKESRRRFDKATHVYDQARERFMSLKKGTRPEVVAELEEDLQNSKSAFERCRFNLVNALHNVESKKKYEFLESVSAIMDAQLRYFKQGHELLSQMEPFVHQVLTYAQQSKEMASIEQDKLAKRIQEFRTQVELDNLRASSNVDASTSGVGNLVVGVNSYKNVEAHKNIEALMQSSASGMVQTIKQGYLLKRSSSLRGDWKRRFFVLDSRGNLYYYRNKGPQSHQSTGTSEHASGVFGRFRSRHHRSSSMSEEYLGCRTVDLRTSTLKIDAEHTDLRLCFRIISPAKTYTLQAENEADRMDWVDKTTGVIASLLNSSILEQCPSGSKDAGVSSLLNGREYLDGDVQGREQDYVSTILREIPGNDLCAECGASEPDWASLNLGILLCIECSGVHRNLGVHISKVRSIKFDVKVWEPSVLDLFRSLGNDFCNSVWEALLLQNERKDEQDELSFPIIKPEPTDTFSKKERYIQAKYVERALVIKEETRSDHPSQAVCIWEAVKSDNVKEVYRLIVTSGLNLNTISEDVHNGDLYHPASSPESQKDSQAAEKKHCDPANCQRISDSGDPANCLQGCSVLHLACHVGDPVMLELLIQCGADVNMRDFHGRTPLHHCISKENNLLAKHLLRRGARPSIKDCGGQNALERAMEMGPITDEDLFILLAE